MRVIAEIAVDRETHELVSSFVTPLDTLLREGRFGRVLSNRANDLSVDVQLVIHSDAGFDRVPQFFAEAGAPLGTIVYQRTWLGRKKNIVMLGP